MGSQGTGAGDFMALSKYALKIHSNVRESRANFGKLNIDVECLLVSIGSLDKSPTLDLITEYCEKDREESESRQQEILALRDGLNSIVMPFYAVFDTRATSFKTPDGTKAHRNPNKPGVIIYVDGTSTTDGTHTPKERVWRRWPAKSWNHRLTVAFDLKDLSDLRSRLTVQAANLNLFLTRLTHVQLARQTELLTLRLSEQTLLRDNFTYNLDLEEATDDFRRDVAGYVKFLLEGGKPYTPSELRQRKAEFSHRYNGRTAGGTHHQHSGSIHKERLALAELQEWKVKRELLERGDESGLDDDARIKLAGARHRLALADLKDGAADDSDASETIVYKTVTATNNNAGAGERPGSGVRRPSEQVILPRPRPNELRRRASSVVVCDVCDRTILSEKTFYRCQSGRCGGSGDTFDVCRRCYSEGERCPGYDKATCLDMDKVIWKESD